jgi:hypothetical protein
MGGLVLPDVQVAAFDASFAQRGRLRPGTNTV